MPFKLVCTHDDPCLLLIVEDDTLLLELFDRELEEAHEHRFKTVQARDLEEMQRALEQHSNIDAIVLDLNLEKMSGLDTLRQALAITEHRIPTVVMTGGDVKEEDAIELGAFALCEKPKVNNYSLLKLVRCAIAHQRFIDKLMRFNEGIGEIGSLQQVNEIRDGLRQLINSV